MTNGFRYDCNGVIKWFYKNANQIEKWEPVCFKQYCSPFVCFTHGRRRWTCYPMIKENEKPPQIRIQISLSPCHVISIHQELYLLPCWYWQKLLIYYEYCMFVVLSLNDNYVLKFKIFICHKFLFFSFHKIP